MATNTEYNKMIENYLNGNMSGSEKSIFEGQLSSDPLLQSELNHQSEIIEGLESFRKAELKTRLAAINLNPTILGLISQTAAIKTAATVATLGLVATGVYYFNDLKENFQLQHVDSIHEFVLEEPRLPVNIEVLDPVEVRKNPFVARQSFKTPKVSEVEKIMKDESQTQSFDFQVPMSPDASESEITVSSENALGSSTNGLEGLANVTKLDKVEVENIIDKKYSFHYRYADGRLYLYGKFSASPYEIIDVNTKNDKKLFFFYQDRYYRIEKNVVSIMAFEEITDQGLIKELSILKMKQ